MSVDATIATWKLKKVTAIQKLLLLSLADRAGESGECWPSIKRLIADTNLNRKTIIENRLILIKDGYISYTGEYKGQNKQIPVMKLLYVNHREGFVNIETDEFFTSTENGTGGSTENGTGGSTENGTGGSTENGTLNLKDKNLKKESTNGLSSPKKTSHLKVVKKEPNRPNWPNSKLTPFIETWNNIAKDNPVLKDISHKRKKDYQQAEKAIKDLLTYWPELGIRSDLPMTPELFGNILHDVTQANWWFITKPDSIRTITMVLRQHNFEEALGILKLNTLRKKG